MRFPIRLLALLHRAWRREGAAGLVLLGVTVLVFLPFTLWLARTTGAQAQLLHALVVLAFAAYYLLRGRRWHRPGSFCFGTLGPRYLLVSFLVMAAACWSRWPPLVALSFILALTGWILFFLGERSHAAVVRLMIPLGVFLLLALTQPALDWPLRALAGSHTVWWLERLGGSARLLVGEGRETVLVVLFRGRPFEVAAECNGFGLLSSSLLLALLLLLHRRLGWIDSALSLALAVLLAGAFNILRILVIVWFAPTNPGAYHLLHEAVGNATVLTCLLLVGALVVGFRPRRGAAAG